MLIFLRQQQCAWVRNMSADKRFFIYLSSPQECSLYFELESVLSHEIVRGTDFPRKS